GASAGRGAYGCQVFTERQSVVAAARPWRSVVGWRRSVYVGSPGHQHGSPLAWGGRAPHAVTVTDFERPGETCALDVTNPAQRDRRIGRLAGRGKERFRIDGLA